MNLTRHPLWLVGFRPFFTLACVAGALLPPLWAAVFADLLPAPGAGLAPIQWHAHEMFYGFGWAVLGGFLLTSTKNWLQIRGYQGNALLILTAAWLLERLTLFYAGALPPLLFRLGANLFLATIVAMLLWTLLRYRHQDSYRVDNVFFLVALPIFLVAKNLLLTPTTFAAGWGMTLALFRLAYLIMLERTLTQFMQSAFHVEILRNPALDRAIKGLALVAVFAAFLPAPLAGALELTLAALLLGRFCFWKPWLVLRRIEVGVMYFGYLAIVAQLLLDGAAQYAPQVWVGSMTVHVFTLGVIGPIVPAMISRIARGHTGRKVVFAAADRAVLWLMLAAFALRVVVPQFAPGAYLALVGAAAACWCVGFALLGWRVVPFLLAPRVDGREH